MSRLRRRPVLGAALVYLALALALVAPALLPGRVLSMSDVLWFTPPWAAERPADLTRPANPDNADVLTQFQPFAQYTRSRLPDMPLWNPAIEGGRPFLADAQSGVFSPFNAATYAVPFWRSLALTAILKLWVSAFGLFLLARALAMRWGAALLAGLVYGFNLWAITWNVFPHDSVWAWIPWMLLLAERIVRRPDALGACGLAAVTGASFLGGHPESSFHALVVTVAFFVLRLVQARRAGGEGRPPIGRAVGGLVAGLAGGALLAALMLLPLAELLLHSADFHQRQAQSVDDHVTRSYALELFFPFYWGRPTDVALQPFLLARAFYAGALPLMLGAAALVLRPRAERVWTALWGLMAIGVVIGLPPFLQIVTRLPVFSGGHNNRLVIWYMLALALLAGWGCDDLLARARAARVRRGLVVGLGAAILLVPLAWVALRHETGHALGAALKIAFLRRPAGDFTDPAVARAIHLAAVVLWIAAAGAALLLVALRLSDRLRPAAFAVLALVLVAVDLFSAGMGYNPAIRRRDASQPSTGAIRYLQSRRPARFVTVGQRVFENVVPMRHGLEEARGYDLPVMERYDKLWRRAIEPDVPFINAGGFISVAEFVTRIRPSALGVLRLMGVRDVLAPRQEPPVRVPGARLAYDGRDARVYALPGAYPRAFVVGGQQVVGSGGAALDAVTRPGFDGRRVAVTEHAVAGLPRGPGGVAGTARLVHYAPERVTVAAHATRPGMLVLSDNDAPGWRATVDGKDADVVRVDYTFRGVRLPAGAHTVVFSYRPVSWRVGWIVSLVSLLVLLAVVAVSLRRRRVASAA